MIGSRQNHRRECSKFVDNAVDPEATNPAFQWPEAPKYAIQS